MKFKKTYLTLMSGAALLLLPACNGILAGIYDEPAVETDSFGFQSPSSGATPGTIFIDATSYVIWNYLDFKSLTSTPLDVSADAPENWDIAIHRYDAKTNGATVAETPYSSFDEVIAHLGEINLTYEADIFSDEKIVTDMSTMMDGYLSYIPSYWNPTLSSWLDVDKSEMPPIYTLSNKIYIIKLKDASRVAVKLINFMDAAGFKGFMTIQYLLLT